MMRELRWRFIGTAMLAIFLVLLVIVGSINASVFWQNNKRMDVMLDLLADNDGRLPASEVLRMDSNGNEPAIDARYFVAEVNPLGEVMSLDADHISKVQADYADIYAYQAFQSGKNRGTVEPFRYLRIDQRRGGAKMYFLDDHVLKAAVHVFWLNSLIIALIGFLAVSGLIILLSGRVIHPFIENMRLQRRFITDAGHELKTPLSIISANADILALTQGENEWTESIHHQVTRMNALISELLKLATVEDRPHHVKEPLDVRQLVQDSIESFKPMATRQNITFRSHVTEKPLMIKGDPQSLANLFSILLDNAIKYATPAATIDIVLTATGKGGARFRITNPTDQPPAPEELNRLFERFYRPDESRSRAAGGFGIGLSMAKAIVDAHHGQISVSGDDRRISFDIHLP